MDLYLIRHGIAGDRGPEYPDDSLRPLTGEGIEKMKKIARGFKLLKPDLEEIVSSPYIRAKQTAEILAQELNLEKLLHFSKNLEPEKDPAFIVDEIAREHSRCSSLALVGHEPLLGNLMSILLSGDETMSVIFKKGGIARLRLDGKPLHGKCASLHSLLTPKQLIAAG